jgi:extradiol dioxygenase family protein
MNAFHLAIPVSDLNQAREFYGTVLGLSECRSALNWVDFNFFGNQLSLHLVKSPPGRPESTGIDGDQVPVQHFGMVMEKLEWEALRDRLSGLNQSFLLGPKIRFQGREGEQGTFFLSDPSGNYLEFKYFTDHSRGLWH